METRKIARPISEDKKFREKCKQLPKQGSNTCAKLKRALPTKEIRRSITPPVRFTQIPKLKSECKKANASPVRRENVKYSSSCLMEKEMQNEELDEKLRLLEAKEKSIADYYEKIKELNRKVLDIQRWFDWFDGSKIPRATVSSTTSFPRRIETDAVALDQREEKSEFLSSFEKNVHQISDIWLRTSSDLTNILTNFKNNSSLDSDQLQIEKSKIQLAMKQAKSLTLIKTKNAIAEAKKLLNTKDGVKNELDDLFENGKEGNLYQKEKILRRNEENGDSKMMVRNACTTPTAKTRDCSLTKDSGSRNCSGEKKIALSSDSGQSESISQPEIAKKNETITLLNNKIFEIQKACNEHLLENSQLQYKIAEMNEKNQWNQVFWKQISKLKDRIKMLQQNNRQLEAQKKELELKIANQNVEIDKMNRLNYLLKRQINMSQEKQANVAKEEKLKVDREAETDAPVLTNSIVLREKENIIAELNNILILMRGQETYAHQKITEFESKIEELKKFHT